MKKLLALLVVGIISLGVLGCGKKEEEKTTDPASDLKVEDVVTIMEIIYEKVELDLDWYEIKAEDMSEEMRIQMVTTLEDISAIEYVVTGDALMMTTPYSFALIKVKEDTDVEEIKEKIFDNADLGKWVCVQADVAYVSNYGSLIMFVMGDEETATKIYEEFGVATGELGTKLEKENEFKDF